MVKGIKEWLWIFANTDFALFHAAGTRSRSELELILGASYTGVLSSDDYSVYNVTAQKPAILQICVGLNTPLSFDLLSYLAGIQPWLWRCPGDSSKLFSEILTTTKEGRRSLTADDELAVT